jgi:YidC/Oxa1 family membrane protein insertase
LHWLDPIVNFLAMVVLTINAGLTTFIKPSGNLGLALIILAGAIRLIFWPLNTAQFKSMMAMQKVAPQLKKLQAKYKEDQPKLQSEMAALYKQHNVNPLAGCLPLLAQMPVLFSVYYVVVAHKDLYANTHFLWIGSPLGTMFPKIFASSLALPDIALIVIYMVSQYISMRFTSMPATDPAQAQQMKMMQIISPLMIGFFGYRAQWPSAMVLYWFAANFFTMAQQLYLIRRYHEPLSFIDSDHVITDGVVALDAPGQKALTGSNGTASTNGAPAGTSRKSKKKRNKKA